jgi:hypothetical protein
MRIVSKEYKLYTFDELADDVKQKLIEKEREYQLETYCDLDLYDDMGQKASDLLNDYFGITSDYLKTYYDLSYSQGSGAMVEFDINIKDLNNKYKIFSDEEMRFIIDNGIVYDIKIRHNDNYYCHEYTFKIDYDYYNDYSYEDIKDSYKISEKDFETLDNRFYDLVDYSMKYSFESEFIQDIVKINKELGKYGYRRIEYWGNCKEDEIIMYIKGYEFEYLENGDVF